jgi:hyperosmotically inducible periplasmic protein
MKTFITFVLGALIGYAVHWFVADQRSKPLVSKAPIASEAGARTRDTFDTDHIKDELSRTGRVVREKTHEAGEALGRVADNAKITASIKAKLLKESALTGLVIDVDTTDGVVTLSGKVSSPKEIERAIDIAMETEGVTKVVSTLQLKEG